MNRDDNLQAVYELSRRTTRRNLDLMLRLYSLAGLLVAIFAGAYFLLTLLPSEPSMNQQVSLMIAGVGTALGLMSRALIALRSERELEELERMKGYESLASFLDAWAQFERISKEALSKEKEGFSPHSFRSVISRLRDEGILDENDRHTLDEALQARNSIVHGVQPSSIRVAERITDSLNEIIGKVSAVKRRRADLLP